VQTPDAAPSFSNIRSQALAMGCSVPMVTRGIGVEIPRFAIMLMPPSRNLCSEFGVSPISE
jgi:hypothetical protein